MRAFQLYLLVLFSGSAALSWEIVWQILASLSIGVSAIGTAVTLAATMGGMSLGAILMARFLTRKEIHRSLLAYGFCELAIGLWGLVIRPAFKLVEACDESVFASAPSLAPSVHLALIFLILSVPTMAMGATIPILGLVAQRFGTSLASVYATNTGGAALGCLIIAFLLIPTIGVESTIHVIAAINIIVFLATILVEKRMARTTVQAKDKGGQMPGESIPIRVAIWIAGITGFATFALEVAWFRSLRSAFQSTTDTFAIILAAVLVALAIGGRLATLVRRNGWSMPLMLACGGILIIAVTPAIERFDLLETENEYWATMAKWATITLATVGPPILFLGVALPWLLDGAQTPRDWGRLYAVNTIGAIVGALMAAWILLPMLGFARSSWIVGVLVAITGISLTKKRLRWVLAMLSLVAVSSSVMLESGIGRERIQIGNMASDYQILDFEEGPDATTSIVELKSGDRGLFIDGFLASSGEKGSSYMAWMGHLPALLHPDPQRGLVICFGTGQTANALRQEPTKAVDIVELSSAVISMGHHFNPINDRVLDDPKVTTTIMDGRAWLRRTSRTYDVITLEPMPLILLGLTLFIQKNFIASLLDG